jgi:hypothetical protein
VEKEQRKGLMIYDEQAVTRDTSAYLYHGGEMHQGELLFGVSDHIGAGGWRYNR